MAEPKFASASITGYDEMDIEIEEVVQRALVITNSIRHGSDLRAFKIIKAYGGELNYGGHLQALGISNSAWLHVKQQNIDPRLMFAHPEILIAHPETSLYYRGIATLSLKRVQQLAGSVDTWEKTNSKAKVTLERAQKVAHLYNSVISSLLVSLTDWELKDAQRNIVATMGISIDGSVRNLIGQNAEKNVHRLIMDWLAEDPGIQCTKVQSAEFSWLIGTEQNIRMEFSSEPDIGFYRRSDNGERSTWQLIATIEIKGGTDPAGALERLGAIKKSFDMTPKQCKNFLVLGVVTDTMSAQMKEMHIERHFLLSQILTDDGYRNEFLNEIFHHALRLLETPVKHLQMFESESETSSNNQ